MYISPYLLLAHTFLKTKYTTFLKTKSRLGVWLSSAEAYLPGVCHVRTGFHTQRLQKYLVNNKGYVRLQCVPHRLDLLFYNQCQMLWVVFFCLLVCT